MLRVTAAPCRRAYSLASHLAFIFRSCSGRLGFGRGPGLIVITPDGKTAYVTSDESIVVPIDTATSTPGPPIAVGVNRPGLHDQPDGIAITPDGRTVYVANIGSGTVTPIDTATNTPGEPVEVGVRPRAIVNHPGRQGRLCRQPEQAAGPRLAQL